MKNRILMEFAKPQFTTIDHVIKEFAQSRSFEEHSIRNEYGEGLGPVCRVYRGRTHIFSVQGRYDEASEKQQFIIFGPALADGFVKNDEISKAADSDYWKRLRQKQFDFMEDE